MRVLLVIAFLLTAGCPKPVPPPVSPKYGDAGPATCDFSIDGGIPHPCSNLFHVGDLRPCAECVEAKGCMFERAALWCVTSTCGGDSSCTAHVPAQ